MNQLPEIVTVVFPQLFRPKRSIQCLGPARPFLTLTVGEVVATDPLTLSELSALHPGKPSD